MVQTVKHQTETAADGHVTANVWRATQEARTSASSYKLRNERLFVSGGECETGECCGA